jgi:hypothetical protein
MHTLVVSLTAPAASLQKNSCFTFLVGSLTPFVAKVRAFNGYRRFRVGQGQGLL